MIILTSNGLSKKYLTDSLKDSLQNKTCAMVYTAEYKLKDSSPYVEIAKGEFAPLNLDITLFDFDTKTPDELKNFDMVYLMGGNPFYLINSIRKGGFEAVLRDFAENKVLVGTSAGAIVLSKSLNAIRLAGPRLKQFDMTDFSALNIYDFEFIPHYRDYVKKYVGMESRLKTIEKHTKILRLSDGEAYLMDKNKSKLLVDTSLLGKTLNVKVDRPINSRHPNFENMTYPINYGYIEGLFAGDNEEQDAYILGENTPIKNFTGEVIAIVHRYNDVEDKLVVAPKGAKFTKQEILEKTYFTERYFDVELVM